MVCWKSSSVSPGNPTMTSVDMAMLGTASRIRRTHARYRAWRYERFIRCSTRSDPDCSGKWMCAHTPPHRRERAGEDLGVLAYIHLGAVALGQAEQVHERPQGMGSHHHVHPGRPLQDGPLVLLGQASRDHDAQARVAVLEGLEVPQLP